MIKLMNVFKNYKNRAVLKCINHTFPNQGLCIIYGASGSGKTTMLNCIAGLISFNGSIEFGNQKLELLNDNDMSQLRLKKYGFVFQDFKLFENETVLANLLFPLETLYQLSKQKKERKCQDLLSLVGLMNKEKQIVNKLSGGEKQRVAIARALINDPEVILADEPTGALDEKNSLEIMNILKIISKKSLVIMVSHDADLTKKFADQVIYMDNGEITKIENVQNEDDIKEHLPVVNNGLTNKKSKIPDGFLLTHTYHNMKQKKGRTIICYSMTSLGLIGVGLAFALSSTIAKNIKNAYREIVDENSIMFSLKNKEDQRNGQFAASYYEVKEICAEYHEFVQDVGITYYADFEQFFPDANNLVIQSNGKYCPIEGFSARHINDFTWLEDVSSPIYPKDIEYLEDDEIILGLDYETMANICYDLQIERSVKSFSEYLLYTKPYLYFDLVNDYWTYSDQQIVRLVGFTLENELKIYHSNHLWNEYMFQERMRFPSSDAISIKDNEPWVMKKIYYLKTYQNRDELLNLLLNDIKSDSFVFEIANENHYPWLYYEKPMEERDRILVFDNVSSHIPLWNIDYILDNDSNLKNPIIGSNGGYAIYPDSLMAGFSKTLYVSKEYGDLESVIDFQTSNNNVLYKENLPSGVKSGNFAKSLQNGVNFSVFEGNLLIGRAPNDLDEIVMSTNLFKELGLSNIDEIVYFATSKKEMLVDGEKIINDYVIVPIRVTGLVKSNKNLIYHNRNWTILFYQCKVGISSFDLTCQNLSFPLHNSESIAGSISKANKAFPQFEIVNPLLDVNASIDKVCFYITIVLIIFSSVATIISVLLLTICNYIYIIEGRKEIALARCLGVNKKESQKFLYYHSLVQCLVSFVIASFELLVISIVANLEIGSTLSLDFSFSFDPIALLPMLALSIIIGVVSSLVMSRGINKINPIEALKA